MPRTSSASSPPGTLRHSLRDAVGPVKGVLRDRGWIWLLSALWVAIGAGGAGYAFVMTTQTCNNACSTETFLFPQWTGEPAVILLVGALAAAVWILLALPLLVAGLVRLRGWRRRNWLRAAGWAGSWVAGLALMNQAADWAAAGLGRASGILSVGEMAICAAWLMLGAVITWILGAPAPPRARSAPDKTVTSA